MCRFRERDLTKEAAQRWHMCCLGRCNSDMCVRRFLRLENAPLQMKHSKDRCSSLVGAEEIRMSFFVTITAAFAGGDSDLNAAGKV